MPTPVPLILTPPLGIALGLLYLYVSQGLAPAAIWRESGPPFKAMWSGIALIYVLYVGFEIGLRTHLPIREIAPLTVPAAPATP